MGNFGQFKKNYYMIIEDFFYQKKIITLENQVQFTKKGKKNYYNGKCNILKNESYIQYLFG